jgi:hypothetical protein
LEAAAPVDLIGDALERAVERSKRKVATLDLRNGLAAPTDMPKCGIDLAEVGGRQLVDPLGRASKVLALPGAAVGNGVKVRGGHLSRGGCFARG